MRDLVVDAAPPMPAGEPGVKQCTCAQVLEDLGKDAFGETGPVLVRCHLSVTEARQLGHVAESLYIV
jgi:hypothetical protein